jgi:hypothetical protein
MFSPTPGPEFDSKIRCSYFCCLQGATVKVVRNSDIDDIDGTPAVETLLDKEKEKADKLSEV